MTRRTASLLALALTATLFSAACASLPMSSSSTGGSALTSSKDAPEYILLSSPSQIRNTDYSQRISAFHVKGTLTNRGFYPAGQVEGNGDFCTDGKDWLSLSDLKVHKASEGGSPAAPYLLGCASGNGFKPATRDIVMP